MSRDRSEEPTSDEATLVQRAIGHDPEAFGRLYDTHVDRVYRHIYYRVGNEQDAEDLTQDVFIRVYRNLRNFRMRSKFFTWLYRITVNTCLSFKRRARDHDPLPQALPETLPLDEKVALRMAIDDALRELPERQRMTFILRHYEGYTFNEIGDIMGISSGAAKANHYHAIRKLRILLEEWL